MAEGGETGKTTIEEEQTQPQVSQVAADKMTTRQDTVRAASGVLSSDEEEAEDFLDASEVVLKYCFQNCTVKNDQGRDVVLCDGDKCGIWYHLECVGLTPETVPPDGTPWYWPPCMQKIPQLKPDVRKKIPTVTRNVSSRTDGISSPPVAAWKGCEFKGWESPRLVFQNSAVGGPGRGGGYPPPPP